MADGAEHFGAARVDGVRLAELIDPVALEARLVEARARRTVALARQAAAAQPLTADPRPARRPSPSRRLPRRTLALALALTLTAAGGLAVLRLPVLRADPPEAATALLAILTPLPPPVAVAAASGAQPTVTPQLLPILQATVPEAPPSVAHVPPDLPPPFAASKARGAPDLAALPAVLAAARSLARPEIARLAEGGATALAEAFPPPKAAAAPGASARARQATAARPDNPIAALGRLLARARRSLAQPPSRRDSADLPARGLRDALERQGWRATSVPDRRGAHPRTQTAGSPPDEPPAPADASGGTTRPATGGGRDLPGAGDVPDDRGGTGSNGVDRGLGSPAGGLSDAGRGRGGDQSRGAGNGDGKGNRGDNGNHGGNNGHGNGNHGGGNNGSGKGGRGR